MAVRHLVSTFLAAFSMLLGACTSPPTHGNGGEALMPISQAWVNGGRVDYVTTDISDQAMAQAAGVNYAPRLAAAVGSTARTAVVERVYKFPQGEQISIFQSAPLPTGGSNLEANYSPLWRLVLVHWQHPDKVRELRSEEELLTAQDQGDVSLDVTPIVVNCPIVRGADGRALKGVR